MKEPRVGDRFEHARQLNTAWKPGPGQKYADAPHAIMEVTRIASPIIYYRPLGSHGAAFYASRDEFNTIVARWL